MLCEKKPVDPEFYCLNSTAEKGIGSLSCESSQYWRVCFFRGCDTQKNFFPRSGKFFDWKSSSRKLACKFAFFLHFLNTMFIVLIPAFSLSSLCEMGAHCIVYGRQEQAAFISSLTTLWFRVAWLLIRDESFWRHEQRRNTCSRFGLLFSFWLLLAVFKLQVVMWESSTAMSVGFFHIC